MNKWLTLSFLLKCSLFFSQKDTILELDTIFLIAQPRFEQSIDFESQNSSLSEQLTKRTPVFIKDYGTGNLATISYQGTSASQTSLFWNNVNLNPINSGVIDYSLIDSYLFDGLNLGTSKNSMQSSGIGADLELMDADVVDSLWSYSAMLKLGSFSDFGLGLKVGYGAKNMSHKLALLASTAQNNFRFYNSINQEFEHRENNANNYLSGIYQASFAVKKMLFQFKTWDRFSYRGIPSPVHVPNQNESQEDGFSRNLLSMERQLKNDWFLTAQVSAFWEKYRYQNPKSAIVGEGSFYRANQLVRLSKDFSSKYQFSSSIFSDQVWAYISDNKHDRKMFGIAVNQQYNPFLKWQNALTVRKEWYFSERHLPITIDYTSSFSPNFSNKIYIRASKNARIPTLNDLYWEQGGNASLVSENAYTGYLGYIYDRKIKFVFESFLGEIRNQIVWSPNSNNGLWTPQNIGYTSRKGFNTELSKVFKFNKLTIEKRLIFSHSDSRDENENQMIYIPKNVLRYNLSVSFLKSLKLEYFLDISGKRYVTRDNSQFLPFYTVSDLAVSKTFKSFYAKLEIKNLFSYTYYNIPFRPMPSRYFGLTVNYEI
jgi:iron complex outermembrane receptor protein